MGAANLRGSLIEFELGLDLELDLELGLALVPILLMLIVLASPFGNTSKSREEKKLIHIHCY